MEITPIGTVGGEGHWLLSLSWSVTGVAAVCFFLRLYTRLVVVKSYGWDDTIYNGSFVLLLACMIMVHISALYGLGQDQQALWNDSPDRLTKALLYLIIGQIFGVSTMGVAKVSLGLFLLRLVTVRWHRVAIWTAIGILFLVTGVTSFVFAFQCAPPAYLWDKTIEGGYCPIPITPFAVLLGAACVAADVFFAVFPWYNEYLSICIEQASMSPLRFRHGAVVVKGDKHAPEMMANKSALAVYTFAVERVSPGAEGTQHRPGTEAAGFNIAGSDWGRNVILSVRPPCGQAGVQSPEIARVCETSKAIRSSGGGPSTLLASSRDGAHNLPVADMERAHAKAVGSPHNELQRKETRTQRLATREEPAKFPQVQYQKQQCSRKAAESRPCYIVYALARHQTRVLAEEYWVGERLSNVARALSAPTTSRQGTRCFTSYICAGILPGASSLYKISVGWDDDAVELS
ncbi:hypothetical protein MAPG_02960 [Magnaporthiopsis poae ATCC 64411]|uniref:Rhodopsin domain-containing protein n=1 Tax=Magnaporthiopsis poae (strain ATCC 64411 / 73-15) TaxID=644358 RepID=A0A0C4DSS2_MAGP6|nr:hypothetical protein MAPG_02960 [Magnaporthiopsis poae ATCC 64411]